MGSRRTMGRSVSGNGRSNNGDELSGSRRSGGCSYLSNVRPENRSTLCSVIAHLTEETQPSFEITLKSRAVSENSTVKFSCVVTGHPTPQITWYKDDAQLDRYCGLPKYEIFRNGQNHSLHIYNCTVDDAAIYQASAANTKGIVSCSGVLEVGEMNEFKIHQRYFDKLKQKAENKRREAEGKENQEPLRTISPDRTLRKRRSTMDAFLSTPSSMEDEGTEENNQDGAIDTKSRLQETTVEKVEEKPVSITNGTASPGTNGQEVSENGTYVYESAQKVFTALQPKTPFVKKKIKISNSAMVSPEEKRAKEELLTPVAGVRAGSTQSKETPVEELMDVARIITASGINSGSRNVTDRYQKPARSERPSKDPSVCVESPVVASAPPKASTLVRHRASDGKGQRMSKQQKETQPKDAEELLEMEDVTSAQQQSSVPSTLLQPHHIVVEDKSIAGHVSVMYVDEKFRSTTDITPPMLLDGPWKSKAALPQHPCELSGDQLSKTETSTDHTNVCVSQPVLVGEVTQAHAQTNRNDAPVNPERPFEQTTMEAPYKTPTEAQTTAHDIQTPPLYCGPQKATDKTTQDARDHSMGSNQSHVGLFTDLQKSAIDSPSGGQTPRGGNASPTTHKSQGNIDIKAVKGKEIRVEKVEHNKVGKILVQSDSHEKKMKIETETAARPTTKPTGKEPTRAGDGKHRDVSNAHVSNKETKKTPIKVEEKTRLESEDPHPLAIEKKTPRFTKDQQNTQVTTETNTPHFSKDQKNTHVSVETKTPHFAKDQQNTHVTMETNTPHFTKDQQNTHVTIETNTPHFSKDQKNTLVTMETNTPRFAKDQQNTHVTMETNTPHFTKDQQNTHITMETNTPRFTKDQQNTHVTMETNTPHFTKNQHNTHVTMETNTQRFTKDQQNTHVTMETNTPHFTKNQHNTHVTMETNTQRFTKDQQNTHSSEPQIKDHQQIPPPVANVISIAELLRSQLKALSNSITMLPTITKPDPDGPGAEPARGFGDAGKSRSGSENKGAEESPPATIKATLLEIYHLLNKTDQELMLQDVPCDPPAQTPPATPPGSATDHCSTVHSPSPAVTKDTPSLDGSETIREEPPTPVKAKPEPISPGLELPKDEPLQHEDTRGPLKLTPEIKVSSESLQGCGEVNDTSELEQIEQRPPAERVWDPDTHTTPLHLTQEDTCVAEDCSTSGTLNPATPEISPRLKTSTCVSPLPSATPQELASGARRKILTPKPKQEEQIEDLIPKKPSPGPPSLPPSPSLPRHSTSLHPPGEGIPPVEKPSPLQSRRKMVAEPPHLQCTNEIPKTEAKPAEKDKHDPFKAPQVIRKIRAETFADTSGHLKLWCQFFNILGESTIKWYRNEVEIAQTKRNAGDETQVNLALVQTSSRDSGVYGCTITNQYGTDATDFLLSSEILTGMSLREDLGVGEEIEMTPLIFNKGVADTCVWTNKLFGRIMVQESHIGDGCAHKVWRAKVIYGLEPVFESGNTCIMKARNPVVYGGKGETGLIEQNLLAVKQECKIQNLAREYCKIFSAEARALEHFGPSVEMIPVYLIYRPANAVPYATVEADLTGVYQKYLVLDATGGTHMRTGSEMEHKCCTLQHWIFQWTNGNLLFTQLEGVDNKITNVRVSVKSTGHQGLPIEGNPKVFEQFVSQHQCNYYCGLLGLKSLKVLESLLMPGKPKGSKSPLLQRKMTGGSSSPQPVRKAGGSPRMPRKAEQDGSKSPTNQKAPDEPQERRAEKQNP